MTGIFQNNDAPAQTKARKCLFSLGSTGLLFSSAFLFFQARAFPSPVVALGFAWSILVFVSVLRLLARFRFPERYYKAMNARVEMALYETLGVLAIRNWIRRGPLHIFAPQMQITSKMASLESLETETRKAETIHAVAFVVSTVSAVVAIVLGLVANGIWLLGLSVPLHAYPIMLQRWNRIRLEGAMKKRCRERSSANRKASR